MPIINQVYVNRIPVSFSHNSMAMAAVVPRSARTSAIPENSNQIKTADLPDNVLFLKDYLPQSQNNRYQEFFNLSPRPVMAAALHLFSENHGMEVTIQHKEIPELTARNELHIALTYLNSKKYREPWNLSLKQREFFVQNILTVSKILNEYFEGRHFHAIEGPLVEKAMNKLSKVRKILFDQLRVLTKIWKKNFKKLDEETVGQILDLQELAQLLEAHSVPNTPAFYVEAFIRDTYELANRLKLQIIPDEDDNIKRSSRHIKDPHKRLWAMLDINHVGQMKYRTSPLRDDIDFFAQELIDYKKYLPPKFLRKVPINALEMALKKRFVRDGDFDGAFFRKAREVYELLEKEKYRFHFVKLLLFVPSPEQLKFIIDTLHQFQDKYASVGRFVSPMSGEYFQSFNDRKPRRSFLFEMRVMLKLNQIDGVEILKIGETHYRGEREQEVDLIIKVTHPTTLEEYIVIIEVKSGKAKMKKKQLLGYEFVSQALSGNILFLSQKVFQSTLGVIAVQDSPVAYAPFGALHMVTSENIIDLITNYNELFGGLTSGDVQENAA